MSQTKGKGGAAKEKETPLMKQYRDIKSRHRDSIVFFRMGDFYEMFYEDAELGSRVLGLTLTSRNNGGGARVPLAGIPVKAANEYLKKLVESGYKVAICEQVEDPKTAKGIVRREVVETITPGVVVDETWLEGKKNNFIVSIYPGQIMGIAAIDLSTGEFFLETTPPEGLDSSLGFYSPREIVVPDTAKLTLPDAMVTVREAWEFDAAEARDDLSARFGVAGVEGLGIESGDWPALAAAAGLFRYIAEIQPSGQSYLARPAIRRAEGIVLDEMTRRNLELVTSLRAQGDSLTLSEVLDRTKTPMGARLLRQRLLAPSNDIEEIDSRLDAVNVFYGDNSRRELLRETLDGVRDIDRLTARAASGRATPRDLGALRDSLGRIPVVLKTVRQFEDLSSSTALTRISDRYDPMSDLQTLLATTLCEAPPARFGDSDAVAPGAHEQLDEYRELRDGGKQFLIRLQARERERTGINSLKVGFNRVFGYYLEITNAHRDAVPEDYERRQTLTNAERYITSELKEYEEKILTAEDRIDELEREIIRDLCHQVANRLERLQSVARLTAELDVFQSLADVARRENYCRPKMSVDSRLMLLNCRHPVVEQMMPRGKFIPNDIHMDEGNRVILLTGPNMAGKSTILRQVGVAVAMAQMGSFVPATEAQIGVVDRIFTRVGASDNLVQGQSTFMVEMSETSSILQGATPRSLVLLDEIGRGTSTYDGVAIAWAVTEHLHDTIGCKTIFATHYHELTQLTEELQHARNMNVAVIETGDGIVFKHTLEPGGADKSYGIHVGKLAGLPDDLVCRAWEVLGILEKDHRLVPGVPPRPTDSNQLPLFETESPLVADLKSLDTDSMTPIEALNRLAELKKRAEES